LFLCDDCKDLFERELFSGIEPNFTYTSVTGYCSYCGLSKEIKERFWYLCGICERIVKSYAAERAATSFILDWWNETSKIDEHIKKIEMKRTDPVRLMSFEEHEKWRKSEHESNPDFTGIEIEADHKLFAVEMKTGRSSIKKMSAFQLDVSDCDDILTFVKSLRIPSYVFHVQVVEEFKPPTFRKVAISGWWASVYDMEKAFTTTRTRQREQRPAAYFKRTAFKPLSEFPAHIASEQFVAMKQRLQKRLPKMYKLQEPVKKK